MEEKYMMEIISIPAGGTFETVEKYRVHAHPVQDRGYGYKQAMYFTFRDSGGIMKSLYTVDFTLLLNPNNPRDIDDYNLEQSQKTRIMEYINNRKGSFGFSSDKFRFYVLTKAMDLPHQPKKPGQNNHCYFTLKEIFSGKEYETSTRIGKKFTYNRSGTVTPQEIVNGEAFTEGNTQQITVNRYERSAKAREECLKHYGYVCTVCGFDFTDVWSYCKKYNSCASCHPII
jgi:hypothetical protein